MNLILDTSILIEIERGNKELLTQLKKLKEDYPNSPRITFVSEFEFLLGINEKSIKNKEKAIRFLKTLSSLQTTKSTATLLANLKLTYQKKGMLLPLADLLIAALVIENNSTLLTKDKDFEPIEELKKILL